MWRETRVKQRKKLREIVCNLRVRSTLSSTSCIQSFDNHGGIVDLSMYPAEGGEEDVSGTKLSSGSDSLTGRAGRLAAEADTGTAGSTP